jgi:diguanylate cyclase (GGDEF)-like protein
MSLELVGSAAYIQDAIFRQIGVGIVTVDRDFRVVLWNDFMAAHSQRPAAEILGKDLFECFPELPEKWLRKKISNVFTIGNYSFSSWEQRPHIFQFRHHRPLTINLQFMRQNSTFLPVRDAAGAVTHVCLTIFDVTDASLCCESLQEASNRDALTGLYNRRYLVQSLETECARMRRYGGCLSFVLFDLDHFKAVNDTYGHLAGDEVLRVTAAQIAPRLRAVDVVGRYGGEEFGVVLPATNLVGAEVVAERIREKLASSPVPIEGGKTIGFTVSIGVAEWYPEVADAHEMFRRADVALYQSKKWGRNRVTLYNPVDKLID